MTFADCTMTNIHNFSLAIIFTACGAIICCPVPAPFDPGATTSGRLYFPQKIVKADMKPSGSILDNENSNAQPHGSPSYSKNFVNELKIRTQDMGMWLFE